MTENKPTIKESVNAIGDTIASEFNTWVNNRGSSTAHVVYTTREEIRKHGGAKGVIHDIASTTKDSLSKGTAKASEYGTKTRNAVTSAVKETATSVKDAHVETIPESFKRGFHDTTDEKLEKAKADYEEAKRNLENLLNDKDK